MFIVLVTGSRLLTDREFVYGRLDHVLRRRAGGEIRLFHGAARGADTLAKDWATARGHQAIAVEAEWAKDGPIAGPRRNTRLVDAVSTFEAVGRACVAFWDGRAGSGTADCLAKAKRAGLPCVAYEMVLDDLGKVVGFLSRCYNRPRAEGDGGRSLFDAPD